MLTLVRKQWFLFTLLLIPLLAYWNPSIGASGGILYADVITKMCMALIFYFSGLSFSKMEFFNALTHYRLAIVIQVLCFVIVPLIMFTLSLTVFPWTGMNPSFILGTLILASVPMTTTSCVIFTAMARGDTVASLFNATLSNFIGVFSAPITIGLFLGMNANTAAFNPLPIIQQLFYLIILPIILGQLTHLILSRWFPVNTEVLFANLGKGLLLFMIYAASCDIFIAMGKHLTDGTQLVTLMGWMVIVYGLIVALAYLSGKGFGFGEAQRRSLLFTAPQKTIVVGLPLNLALISHAQFTGDIQTGFLLLPLLIYNYVQWIGSALLVRWLNGKTS